MLLIIESSSVFLLSRVDKIISISPASDVFFASLTLFLISPETWSLSILPLLKDVITSFTIYETSFFCSFSSCFDFDLADSARFSILSDSSATSLSFCAIWLSSSSICFSYCESLDSKFLDWFVIETVSAFEALLSDA